VVRVRAPIHHPSIHPPSHMVAIMPPPTHPRPSPVQVAALQQEIQGAVYVFPMGARMDHDATCGPLVLQSKWLDGQTAATIISISPAASASGGMPAQHDVVGDDVVEAVEPSLPLTQLPTRSDSDIELADSEEEQEELHNNSEEEQEELHNDEHDGDDEVQDIPALPVTLHDGPLVPTHDDEVQGEKIETIIRQPETTLASSVRPSIHPSIHPSMHPAIHPSMLTVFIIQCPIHRAGTCPSMHPSPVPTSWRAWLHLRASPSID